MGFFKLDYLKNYVEKFNNTYPDNQITKEMITIPDKFDFETFEPLCKSESMKKGLLYFTKQYNNEPSELYDIIVFSKNNSLISFVFVKKIGSCIKTDRRDVISIEGICSNQKGGGKILLGFTILNALKQQKKLVLQVDDGFKNKTAYCLYSNMGFEIDIKLLPDCYKFDSKRLVMKLNDYVNEENMFSLDKIPFCLDIQLQDQANINKQQAMYILTQLETTSKVADRRKIIKNLDPSFLLELLKEDNTDILYEPAVIDLIIKRFILKLNKDHGFVFSEGRRNTKTRHPSHPILSSAFLIPTTRPIHPTTSITTAINTTTRKPSNPILTRATRRRYQTGSSISPTLTKKHKKNIKQKTRKYKST
tara:strand:- start:804 stop:1892 length:1089 start_codon:yes stop_codon:yes gene_type:complete